jgi:RNA polymerase sigma factor (sigma-70 family)
MVDDTGICGGPDRFPATSWSAILAARDEDEGRRAVALDLLITAYWKPVYKYIRIKWNKPNEDAKDLTQGFFAKVIENDFFRAYDPRKARFRTFLRTCLDGFISNEEKSAHRIKRGGEIMLVPLDFENAEGELQSIEVPVNDTPDKYFDREWARGIFGMAVEELRAECDRRGKAINFLLFERYYLDDTDEASYEWLAQEFGLPATQVTNYLAFTRRELRRILLEKLRQMTFSDEEFDRETRLLLGMAR